VFAVDRYIYLYICSYYGGDNRQESEKTEDEIVFGITHIVFSIIFISCVLYYVSYKE